MQLITKKKVSKSIPSRKSDAHKGDCGRVVIIGGSKDMVGAVVLVAKAALRSGAGLVYVISPGSISPIIHGSIIEAIVRGVGHETKQGTLTQESLYDAKDIIKNADVLVIGPGLGQNKETKKAIRKLLGSKNISLKNLQVVVDADAINVLDKATLKKQKLSKNPLIITPHPGEMARLINKRISEVQRQRIFLAEKISEELDSIIILKGHKTVVACSGKKTLVNPTGNSGMATAGAGDVLSGVLAGFLAQGVSGYGASKLAVYIHGLAGDLAEREKGTLGLIASDIIDKLPKALLSLAQVKGK